MQPVTLQTLADNPFRTLGVSASASEAAIESAARRMRIWPDPQRIPSTPWDLPSLGSPSRSRQQIEQSVAALRQPLSRIEAQLLWYAGEKPPASGPPPLVAPTAPLDRHNIAIAALHAAIRDDPDIADANRWQHVLRQFLRLSADSTYVEWLGEQDRAGGFEKRTSLTEMSSAVADVPKALSAAMVLRAQAALDRGDDATCAAIFAIISSPDAPPGDFAPPGDLEQPPPPDNAGRQQILDRLEDAIMARCRELDETLRDKLRTDKQNLPAHYLQNVYPSSQGSDFYNVKIAPALQQLTDLASNDAERLVRVRTACAEVLTLLALGWEWAGHFLKSVQRNEEALQLLGDSSPGLSFTISEDLDRVKPQAAKEWDAVFARMDQQDADASLAEQWKQNADDAAEVRQQQAIPAVPLEPHDAERARVYQQSLVQQAAWRARKKRWKGTLQLLAIVGLVLFLLMPLYKVLVRDANRATTIDTSRQNRPSQWVVPPYTPPSEGGDAETVPTDAPQAIEPGRRPNLSIGESSREP